MAQRAGVSFELERLDVEDDKLIVSGHWSGVRGLRFVRPTLVAEDRRILATLEHKPWAPAVDRTWIAAFPWDGDEVDVDGLALAVSSQVTVPLGDAPAPLVAERAPAPAQPAATAAARKPEPAPEPAAPERRPAPEFAPVTPIRARTPQPDPVPEPAPAPYPAEPPPVAAAPPRPDRDRLAALEEELYDMRRAREVAERDRDRALAQLDEAIAAREAAVRTRARMEVAQAEALAARDAAEAAVAGARAQRDEANSQRDEVLLAYRALQRHVQSERAHDDRAGEPPAEGAGGDREEPIGVRTMPAARTVMAELQRPQPARKLPFSVFDLWVARVLGTVAAGCFILLLISILRVFV